MEEIPFLLVIPQISFHFPFHLATGANLIQAPKPTNKSLLVLQGSHKAPIKVLNPAISLSGIPQISFFCNTTFGSHGVFHQKIKKNINSGNWRGLVFMSFSSPHPNRTSFHYDGIHSFFCTFGGFLALFGASAPAVSCNGGAGFRMICWYRG